MGERGGGERDLVISMILHVYLGEGPGDNSCIHIGSEKPHEMQSVITRGGY